MIITHHWKQYCLEVGQTLKKIEWNRDVLMEIIQKKYQSWTFVQPNTFYLRWQLGEYTSTNAITIISPFHLCEFVVSAELVAEVWVRNVFGWLFDRSFLSFSILSDVFDNKHDAYQFWQSKNECTDFPLRQITSLQTLIQESMIVCSVIKDNQRQASAMSSLHGLRRQWLDNQIDDVSGNGLDTDRYIAHQKACSEARERNACGWIQWALPPDHTVQVAKDIVRMYCWTGSDIDDARYPITQWWTNKHKAIPGQILFYPYAHGHLWKGNSNGVACHTSMQAAFENGLLELIERDAFVLRRLTKQWWKRIVPCETTKQHIQQITWWLFSLDLIVLSFGVLPVVLALVKKWKKIMVAAWTGYSLEQAIQKACSETKQFFHHLDIDHTIQSTDSVIMRHIKWYLDETHYNDRKRVESSEVVTEQDSWKQWMIHSCAELVTQLQKKWVKLYMYVYEYLPVALAWRVCLRVLSSDYLPLWFWKKIPAWIIESPRLRYRMEALGVSTINTALHPFG